MKITIKKTELAYIAKIEKGVYEVCYKQEKIGGLYFHKATAEKICRRFNKKLIKERDRLARDGRRKNLQGFELKNSS